MNDGDHIGGMLSVVRSSKLHRLSRDELLRRVQSWRDTHPIPEEITSREQALEIGGPDLTHLDLSNLDLSDLDLRGIKLTSCDLHNAKLNSTKLDGALLFGCDLSGAESWVGSFRNASLRQCYIVGARFMHADFEGASFAYSNLERTIMIGTLHGRDTWFFNARLQGVNFSEAHLSQVDFRDARTMYGAYLYLARLDGAAIDYSLFNGAIGHELDRDYHKASVTYSSIKANLDAAGRYDEAAKAYIKERKMEKYASAPWNARRVFGERGLGDVYEYSKDLNRMVRVSIGSKWRQPKTWWFYISHSAKWISDSVIEALCSYGESPGRVVFWMALTLFLITPLTLHLAGGLYWPREVIEEFLSLRSPILRALYPYLQYVLYSIDTFTTADFARLGAANDLVRLFSGLFALAGIFLAGLLGFVAGNRIRHS